MREGNESDYPAPAVVPVRRPMLPTEACDDDYMYCSLPRNTPLQRAEVAALLLNESPKLTAQMNMSIDVCDVICTTRVKDGESLPYVLLISPDGSAVCTYGRVPCNCLATLVKIIGRPPWKPALPIKIVAWEGPVTRADGEVITGRSVSLALDMPEYRRRLSAGAPADAPAKKGAKS